jgi:hypothetical protein
VSKRSTGLKDVAESGDRVLLRALFERPDPSHADRQWLLD